VRPRRPPTLTDIANERVPFSLAASWLGIETRERGVKADCPLCGSAKAMRMYEDHGWCNSCRTYLSAVGLLAESWKLDRDDAAYRALDRIGYRPMEFGHLWEEASAEPEPAREELADALRVWCGANCPDWDSLQFDPEVAGMLARLLGILPKVRTRQQCAKWLAAGKTAMGRVLSPH
jgi:predicted RNA-binding Zn-ribbon protein involved in translation (DUF1610 family)